MIGSNNPANLEQYHCHCLSGLAIDLRKITLKNLPFARKKLNAIITLQIWYCGDVEAVIKYGYCDIEWSNRTVHLLSDIDPCALTTALNQALTRMHSSRMRTVRSLTVSRSICHAPPPPRTAPPD